MGFPGVRGLKSLRENANTKPVFLSSNPFISKRPKNISKKGLQNRRSLGYARDDKGEGGASIQHSLLGATEQQVPPLRFASVGMTLLFEGWSLDGKIGRSEGRTADNPGTLGMTKGTVATDLKSYAGRT